jgi:outer membrane protein TolC
MSSTTSSTPGSVDQSELELITRLDGALEQAKLELAELEPRREQLSARVATLEHTLAVYKGETPAPVRKRRAASKRRPKAAPETPAAA